MRSMTTVVMTGISQVVASGLEADVRGEQRGGIAVAGVDDLKEQRGVSGRFLLQAVEAYLVNEKDQWSGENLELLVEASVQEAGHQLLEHLCSAGVAAAIELLATQKQQCLGDVAFACA